MSLTQADNVHSQNQLLAKVYWPELDGLRFFAFFWVFLFHLGSIPGDTGNLLLSFVNTVINWGWLGVELFFVLSAFLIAFLLHRERQKFGSVSFRLFWMRRLLRIWPLYFLILFLGFFAFPILEKHLTIPFLGFPVFGMLYDTPPYHAVMGYYFWPHVFFLGNFCYLFPAPPSTLAIGQLWSITMEEQFYLVGGLLLCQIRKTRTLLWSVMGFILLSFTCRVYFQSHSPDFRAWYLNTISHLEPWLVGVGLATLWSKSLTTENLLRQKGTLILLSSILLLGWGMMQLPPVAKNDVSMVWGFALLSLGLGLLLLSSITFEPLRCLLRVPALVFLGRISYGLYVFHNLGQELGLRLAPNLALGLSGLLHCGIDGFQFWFIKAFCCFGVTALCAVLSWFFFEKWFLKLKKQYSRVPSGA